MSKKIKPEYLYEVVTESANDELGTSMSYGISVSQSLSRGYQRIACVSGVSKKEEAVIELVKKCNLEQLEPIHLDDVIDDFRKEVIET